MRELTVLKLSELRALRGAAQDAPRRRVHRALHRDATGAPDYAAPLQALLLAGAPGTYVVPHRFDRDQCFAVLTGEWGFLFWDAQGQFVRAQVCAAGEVAHVPAGAGYHTWVCLRPGALLETLPGPHVGDRHDLPDYPAEGTEAAARVLRSWEHTLGGRP